MVSQRANPRTLMEAMRHFTPEVADAYVASIKWPSGPCCSACGSTNVLYKGRVARCRERGCRKKSRLTASTIMHDTHLRLDQWCVAVWMIVNCRNGVSSHEIHRSIGARQQSCWHLLHRVRHILAQSTTPMMGTVEADSTLVGGLLKHMHAGRRARLTNFKGQGQRLSGKTIVHAIRERHSGHVRAHVIESERTDVINPLIEANVRRGARIMTDASHSYRRLWRYRHEFVNHTEEEYVRGECHVQGCENFFSNLRRSLRGTYIRATPEHLSACVDEAVFRFNVRKKGEWERFHGAMTLILGKRLTYSELTGGAVR